MRNSVYLTGALIMVLVILLAGNNSCKKQDEPADTGIVIETSGISGVTQSSAMCGGVIATDGGSTITARGVCWSTGQTPSVGNSHSTDGAGAGTFTSTITGLSPKTTYYARAYATNGKGTAYGSTMSFTTWLLATAPVTNITPTAATCGGTITAAQSNAIIERGVCWSAGHIPTIADTKTSNGSGSGTFISEMTGLSYNTTYTVRMYATGISGTDYGDALSFSTKPEELVTDIDGNTYHMVTIGTQVWLRENLKTTHYRNGAAIPLVNNSATWGTLSTGAYCYFNNDPSNNQLFGKLYNWYAVNDSRKLAPAGWHVPTISEWNILYEYLGGKAVAGGKMKSTGTDYWRSPNTGASNSSGFTGYPGGNCSGVGFTYSKNYGNFWSSDYISYYEASTAGLTYYSAAVTDDVFEPKIGNSVRCIKD
ncbi:MAG: fibrobacter succinogenes major paralogous domain-containing protein [Bacteroidales bacterium]